MNWIPLNDMSTLEHIKAQSLKKPQLIFKHSTRCSISNTAKNRLDNVVNNEIADCYYLDLLTYREISNKIAEEFQIFHESPQIILIKNGKVVYDESHLGIQWDDIVEQTI